MFVERLKKIKPIEIFSIICLISCFSFGFIKSNGYQIVEVMGVEAYNILKIPFITMFLRIVGFLLILFQCISALNVIVFDVKKIRKISAIIIAVEFVMEILFLFREDRTYNINFVLFYIFYFLTILCVAYKKSMYTYVEIEEDI